MRVRAFLGGAVAAALASSPAGAAVHEVDPVVPDGRHAGVVVGTLVMDGLAGPPGLSDVRFDYSVIPEALFVIRGPPGFDGVIYWCDASLSDECYMGRNVVPIAVAEPSSVRTSEGRLEEMVAIVPEPAVWALMLLGLCAVGAALRRRRRGLSPTAV